MILRAVSRKSTEIVEEPRSKTFETQKEGRSGGNQKADEELKNWVAGQFRLSSLCTIRGFHRGRDMSA
jgi:hypothetical protein